MNEPCTRCHRRTRRIGGRCLDCQRDHDCPKGYRFLIQLDQPDIATASTELAGIYGRRILAVAVLSRGILATNRFDSWSWCGAQGFRVFIPIKSKVFE
jgi:hypothetical protein